MLVKTRPRCANIRLTRPVPARLFSFSEIRFQPMSIEIESTNPVVKAVIEGTAPRPARIAAARGILPLPQNDLLEVLVAFVASGDVEIAEHARMTISNHNVGVLR